MRALANALVVLVKQVIGAYASEVRPSPIGALMMADPVFEPATETTFRHLMPRVSVGATVGVILLAGAVPIYAQVEVLATQVVAVAQEADALTGPALFENMALDMFEVSLPRTALLDGVAARLAGCTGPMGVKETLPVADGLPPLSEMVASMQLRSSPGIQDGYTQVLHLHGPSNSAYLVQRGGFGGSETVFGPLSMHDTCKPARYTWK